MDESSVPKYYPCGKVNCQSCKREREWDMLMKSDLYETWLASYQAQKWDTIEQEIAWLDAHPVPTLEDLKAQVTLNAVIGVLAEDIGDIELK